MDSSAHPHPHRSAPPRRRTGGRSARVVKGVLEATLDELARVGYPALSFEDVAARAGVSRTTVYRRWPTKADLVRAAVLRLLSEEPPPPDTGSLRGDLLQLLDMHVRRCSPRDISLVRGVMAAGTDPDVVALAQLARERRQERYFAVVDRAVHRGELPAGTDARLVVEPLLAVFHLRLSLFGEIAPQRDVERLTDLVIAGARTGAAVAPR